MKEKVLGTMYLAGFFDGRGCFNIRKDKNGFLQFKVKLADKDKRKIEIIKQLLNKLDIKSLIDSFNCLWITSRKEVKKLINLIKPFSILKKQEIEEFEEKIKQYEEKIQTLTEVKKQNQEKLKNIRQSLWKTKQYK